MYTPGSKMNPLWNTMPLLQEILEKQPVLSQTEEAQRMGIVTESLLSFGFKSPL
ncbi:hypothetical protein HPG69_006490 [Diceros bicornis minor]|uniref:Uncharacterized protein n=1 Tax=Diceros bicornis minor TaxID=77932 RepID=A0A7J7EWX4_DICBM|nr:hypothetical protein HPG69_006490 [Diceros bicornis minor]